MEWNILNELFMIAHQLNEIEAECDEIVEFIPV